MERIEYSLSFSSFTGKTWIAEITGTDRKFGYAREFVSGKKSASRSGATGSFVYLLSPGLYEECERGSRQYAIVAVKKNGTLGIFNVGSARIDAVLGKIGEGMEFQAAVEATRPTPK